MIFSICPLGVVFRPFYVVIPYCDLARTRPGSRDEVRGPGRRSASCERFIASSEVIGNGNRRRFLWTGRLRSGGKDGFAES